MNGQRTEVEVDPSGTIHLPPALRRIWRPTGRLEASVFGAQLIISPAASGAGIDSQFSTAARIAAFRDWMANVPCHHREPLSDQAVSREEIYD